MKTARLTLNKALSQAALALLLFSATATNLLAWGPGVHAYIADQIAKKAGWKNVNEMYGAIAPDVINYMFYSPYLSEMYVATHYDFERLWQASPDDAGTDARPWLPDAQ